MSLVVVMGVSGSGKSTVGPLVAERCGVPFLDADALHSRSSVDKMARGEALTDDDRQPWLERVADALVAARQSGGLIVGCSALRVTYRDSIRRGASDIFFAHLAPPPGELRSRMNGRVGHFMPPSLLHSQLATVEALEVHEWGMEIEATGEPGVIADQIVRALA